MQNRFTRPHGGAIGLILCNLGLFVQCFALTAAHGADVLLRNLQDGEGLLVLPSREPSRTVPWEDLFSRGPGQGISFGVLLLGPDPYSRAPDVRIPPASTSKLFTSALALERLGPDFRFRTDVTWKRLPSGAATELTLAVDGDPTWGTPPFGQGPDQPPSNPLAEARFQELADHLLAEGVREVRLPVVIRAADSRLANLAPPDAWEIEDLDYCYGARPEAVTLALGCAIFQVNSLTQGQFLDSYVPTPVTVRLKSGSSTSLSVKSARIAGSTQWGLTITGTLKSGSTPTQRQVRVPIHDSRPWLRRHVERALKAAGIRLLPAFSCPGERPLRRRYALALRSPPLSEILPIQNKDSINIVADSLFLAAGLRAFPSEPNAWVAGRAAMRTYLDTLGPELSPTSLVDGSGLSRSSMSTAKGLVRLLEDFLAHPQRLETLWASLPIAGVDGTLKTRMKGTAAEGRLRAKTGTLSGHYNLSGFAPRRALLPGEQASDPVPFTILTSTSANRRVDARAVHDRAGAQLCELLDTSAPQLIGPLF